MLVSTRLDTSNVSRRDVTSQVEFGLYSTDFCRLNEWFDFVLLVSPCWCAGGQDDQHGFWAGRAEDPDESSGDEHEARHGRSWGRDSSQAELRFQGQISTGRMPQLFSVLILVFVLNCLIIDVYSTVVCAESHYESSLWSLEWMWAGASQAKLQVWALSPPVGCQ